MDLLYEKVKQEPIFYDCKMKSYKGKDVISNASNAGAEDPKLIQNGS